MALTIPHTVARALGFACVALFFAAPSAGAQFVRVPADRDFPPVSAGSPCLFGAPQAACVFVRVFELETRQELGVACVVPTTGGDAIVRPDANGCLGNRSPVHLANSDDNDAVVPDPLRLTVGSAGSGCSLGDSATVEDVDVFITYDVMLVASGCDEDGDAVPNVHDNCRHTANPEQADNDADGTGDQCDDETRMTCPAGTSATVICMRMFGSPALVFRGTVAPERFVGSAGRDQIATGGGHDVVEARAGDDSVAGEEGNDRISGGPGDDHVYAHAGHDVLEGDGGEDTVSGGPGNDRVGGGAAKDQRDGGDGNDRMNGGTGDDTIDAGAGNDVLRGAAGADRLDARTGRDRLDGGSGVDTLIGGGGIDVINAVDGSRKPDGIACGTGKHDRARAEWIDRLRGCEHVKRVGRRPRAPRPAPPRP